MKEQTQDAGNDRELPLPELAGKTVGTVEVVASGDEDAPGAVDSYVVLNFTDGSTLYAGDEPTAYRAIPGTPAVPDARAALLGLVRYIASDISPVYRVELPIDLHAQIRLVLGDDFYSEVVRDGDVPDVALGPDPDDAFAASPEEIAEAAETAYMAEDYGFAAFRRIAKFLLDKGHSAYEAEAILRSKHLRWADDSQGRGVGRKTTSAAFIRYYEASQTNWQTVARTLAAESSLTLRDEA